MVTMSAIWDRTAEVLRGRGSMLAGIAATFGFAPAVVQDAVSAWSGKTPGALAIAGLVTIAAAVLSIWGSLALVAAASDPGVDRRAAIATGARRLSAALGVSVLLGVALIVALLPVVLMVGAGALDLKALGAGTMPTIAARPSAGVALGALVYSLVFVGAAVWASARLSLFSPVLVNERLSVGGIARSFELTRGLTWRIVGVAILFGIVLLVALSATQLVVSLVARLVVGADGVATARFAGGVAGAAVTAGGSVVSATFLAQLYRVVSGREAARAFA